MRLLGWLFILLALVALTLDFRAWLNDATFDFRALGVAWAELHRSSLQTLQPAIERHIHEDAYMDYVRPVLLTPGAPLLGAIGVALLFLRFALRLPRKARI